MFVYLVIYLQMSTRGSLWREASVFAGSSRKAFAIFQKKGISLVYLQAFREYIHVIVVSAITHLTTATTFKGKLAKPQPLSLHDQECLVKVAIAFAGDIRSLETFWEGEGDRGNHVFGRPEDFLDC